LGRGESQDLAGRADQHEAARIYERLVASHIYDSTVSTADLYNFVRGLNLTESSGPSAELARLYANIIVGLGSTLRQYGQAESYLNRLQEIGQSVTGLDVRAWVEPDFITAVWGAGRPPKPSWARRSAFTSKSMIWPVGLIPWLTWPGCVYSRAG
jgi:hypothetical protein